jgi:tetratricopeptide (TPR) repeat protein
MKAEPFYQRALAINEKALGPEHLDSATGINNLATLYHNQGQYVKAELFYQRALAILEGALGPEHPNLATCLENYALCLRAMERSQEGDCLKLVPRQFGQRQPD